MRSLLHVLREEDGLNLVELVIAAGVASLVTLIALTALNQTQRTEVLTSNDSQALASLRIGTQQLTRELRHAGKLYAGSDDTKVEFWVDGSPDCAGAYTTANGMQEEHDRIIWEVKTVDGRGALTRTTRCPGSPTRVVVEDIVVEPAFIYVPEDEEFPITAKTLVKITLAGSVEGAANSPTRRISTEVRLRNAPG